MPASVLFLGLARNCARTLPCFFRYLKQLEACGFKCAAIIGEDSSLDNTRYLIESEAGFRISLVDTDFMATCSSRLARMAIGRQVLLDAARKNMSGVEYVCVVDLDQAIAVPPEVKNFQASVDRLKSDSTLFAIGASSLPVYYDLLSLRADGYEYVETLSTEIQVAKKHPLSYYRFHQKRIYSIQRDVTQNIPFSCTSSFNGFCIYSAADYCLGSYRAENEAEVCEHVSMNLSIGRLTGKKMLVSSELALQAPAEHISAGLMRFWWDRAVRRLSKTGKKLAG